MISYRLLVFGLVGCFFGISAATAESSFFVDTTAARQQWFDRTMDWSQTHDVLSSQVISVSGAPDVEVRIDEQLGNRYHVFVRHDESPTELARPGTYIVRQRRADGAIDQIKVFLQYDNGTFFRLRPRENRRILELDLYVAGSELYHGVTVPLSLERALRAPISDIQRLTEGIIDWSIVEPKLDRWEYTAIARMVTDIRKVLSLLTDAEDGAMDAEGSFVHIDSLDPMEKDPGFNCSGFAKWVVDGLYRPITGSLIPIEVLREKHVDYRGTRWSRRVEDTGDPYFGLDWTRNLSRELYAVRRSVSARETDPEARDVRSVPMARYREDVGFLVDELREIVYWLAVKEPGMIYLASINRSVSDKATLRRHHHVVVIMPYFDDEGRFQSVVMERNLETDVRSLIRRFEGEFVHLVRIDGTQTFDPVLPTR